MLSVRILDVDHYQSVPTPGLDVTYSQFRGSQVKHVPVIRIFGSTPSGQKTCLHVHGVFPYFYVPYDGSDEPARFMYQIAASLDKAINISLGRSNSNTHHVFKIVQVSGKPFYGYHSKEHQFLKIFLYNPLLLKRAIDLLQNGVICNKIFQPFEAHIPFILQFFIDYNLVGMNFIDLKNVSYRSDVSSEENVPSESVKMIKASWCEIEADAVATDILNRLPVAGELAVNPGLVAIWEDEKHRRGEENEISQQESQPRPWRNPTISEIILKEKLKQNLRMQGRNSGQRSVLQEIPYPVETQEGSNILNASTVEIHHTPYLQLPTQSQHEESIVNEDLVLSLTSTNDENAIVSHNSSIVNMLIELAERNTERRMNQEILKAVIDQSVENDSILGSQILVENEDETLQDVVGGEEQSQSNKNKELILECEPLEEEMSPALPHESTNENWNEYADDNETTKTSEGSVHWDDTAWDVITDADIPQLDGAGDGFDEDENCLYNIKCGTENTGTDHKHSVTSNTSSCKSLSNNNWCNKMYDLSNIETVETHNETNDSDYEVTENVGNSLNNVLLGDPSFTYSTACSTDELTCTVNKSSCDNSDTVTRNELENTSNNNSDVFIESIVDSCNPKLSVWKDTSESDIYKNDSKEDTEEFSTSTVPLSSGSILEIEGCENVCEGIVGSEPLCYDNLLETSQFDDSLSPSSFIEYQNVESVDSSNKRTAGASSYKKNEYNSVNHSKCQKGKLKLKFSFSNKKMTRKLKKSSKLCKSKLIYKAFDFIDNITEDMVSSYFTQVEQIKQCHNNKGTNTGKGLINLSWSKISLVKSKWKKIKFKQNSMTETLDMRTSCTLRDPSVTSFNSYISELLPCSDLPKQLFSNYAPPADNKYKEICLVDEVQNCGIKYKRQDEENVRDSSASCGNCFVRIQQLTCHNINNILKHYQIQIPDLYGLQQHKFVNLSTNELESKSCTDSPSRSQLYKASDISTCQSEQSTESIECFKKSLKVRLQRLLLSDHHNNYVSNNKYINSTQRHNITEKTSTQYKKAVVVLKKLNIHGSSNVYPVESKPATDRATNLNSCFVKLEKLDCLKEKVGSKVRSKNCNNEELKENSVSNKLCTNMSERETMNELNKKSKDSGKAFMSVCSVVMKHEKCIDSSFSQAKPAIYKTYRDRNSKHDYKRFPCTVPVTSEEKKNVLYPKLYQTKEVNTLNKNCLQVRDMQENRSSTLTVSTFYNIQCDVNSTKIVETCRQEKENIKVNKKMNQVNRDRRSLRSKTRFTNIVCIDGTYDGSSSDSCDSQQSSSQRLVQIPKHRHREVSDSQQSSSQRLIQTPKHHRRQASNSQQSSSQGLVQTPKHHRRQASDFQQSSSQRLIQTPKHHRRQASDSQQSSSQRLAQAPQTPKRRGGQEQGGSNQGTPKHRYDPLRIEIKKSPTSKSISHEQKSSQIDRKLDAELRVLVTKDDKEIRRASNKRPAVGFEQDMSTAEKMTKVPKQIRLEENKRPEHVLLDVDTLTDNRLNVLKKTKLEKTIESLSQETNISTNAANRSKRTLNTELRVCLHRLPIREEKTKVEENIRLTRTAIRRLDNTL